MKKVKKDNSVPRPPIVVVMGHIDHGKTTLLDFIRKTKVTECETGGITQHVGAYEIEVEDKQKNKRKVTFLDTPGHEAFSKIRSRGTKIADIAILVIAVDDGVKNQTEEALKAIKEAKIPFVVAINKIDKEDSNPDHVKKELTEKEVYVEGWGGKTPVVNISAKTGVGVEDLLEMILLVTELEELKTSIEEKASGYVVESHIDKKRGTSATLIIQNGTLKQGMLVVAGNAVSPVRIFEDSTGCAIKQAQASSPIRITGFNTLPDAGALFKSFDNKKEAEKAAQEKTLLQGAPKDDSLEAVAAKEEDKEEKKVILPIVIKTDVAGSVEALEKQFKKLQTEKVLLNILRAEVGDINEDDVKLASSGEEPVITGFNVSCASDIKILAERLGVTIKLFDIIYEAEKWIDEEIKKREPVEEKEEIVGKAKVLKIFKDDKSKKIVGGEVKSGKIILGGDVKIFRRDYLLGEGKIVELKQQQTNKKELPEGDQFGALIQTKADIAPRDTLEIIEKTTA